MARQLTSDLIGILNGLRTVVLTVAKQQETDCYQILQNSSVLNIQVGKPFSKAINIQNHVLMKETLQRTSMVLEGLKGYVKYTQENSVLAVPSAIDLKVDFHKDIVSLPTPASHSKIDNIESLSNDILPTSAKPSSEEISEIIRELDSNRLEEEINKQLPKIVETETNKSKQPPQIMKARTKRKQILSESAKQRTVPSSRLSRMISFGSLAAGLGVGTVAEVTRRSLGLGSTTLDAMFLTPANAERIVNTLCKVRGAALKIGQILSIQDNNIISPELQKTFDRVRQSADFMPSWQIEKVLNTELGDDWQNKIASFEMKPFAAASIGQVHSATLHDGTEVAMKIQYPGVAKGIESDIDNLVGILKIWNIFPEGMFIDNIVEVAKRELAWEVDYIRESECTKKFKKLLEPYPDYMVPSVVDDLSTSQIFTSELIEGVPVDKCQDMDENTRKHICSLVMQLCLQELFQFRFMQTDPNWSNFFYNTESKQNKVDKK